MAVLAVSLFSLDTLFVAQLGEWPTVRFTSRPLYSTAMSGFVVDCCPSSKQSTTRDHFLSC